MLNGKALRDFNESNIERTDNRINDHVSFFKTKININESCWFDYVLEEKVKVYTLRQGDLELFFYNEGELIFRLNNDYNQEFD